MPAGSYQITTLDPSALSCASASKAFTRFLQDFDGKLPSPWRLNALSGTFTRGSGPAAFEVALDATPTPPPSGGGNSGGGGTYPEGNRCGGTFRVLHNDRIGRLKLPAGRYRITLGPSRPVSCKASSRALARFLARPDGSLPERLEPQRRDRDVLPQWRGRVPDQADGGGGERNARRSLTPSFCIARYMCDSTVRTESTSRSAISALVMPRAASSTSCASRGVSSTSAASTPRISGSRAALVRVQLARACRGAAGRVLAARRREGGGGVGGRLRGVAVGADRRERIRRLEQRAALPRRARLDVARVGVDEAGVGALAGGRHRRGELARRHAGTHRRVEELGRVERHVGIGVEPPQQFGARAIEVALGAEEPSAGDRQVELERRRRHARLRALDVLEQLRGGGDVAGLGCRLGPEQAGGDQRADRVVALELRLGLGEPPLRVPVAAAERVEIAEHGRGDPRREVVAHAHGVAQRG